MNSPGVIWSEGAFFFEACLRICSIICFVHAWKHGYFSWVLSTFIFCLWLESWSFLQSSGHGYCIAESILMREPCNEISLHASWFIIWLYPPVLAIHRLGVPALCRPFAIAFLGYCNGQPFDMGGAAAGMWYFPADSGLWGTTVFPDAFGQYLFVPLVLELMFECMCLKRCETNDSGYPQLSKWKQVVIGLFAIPLGYICMYLAVPFIFGSSLALAWFVLIIVSGLIFAFGLLKCKPAICMERDWMPFIAPIVFLLNNLIHTEAARRGNRVVFDKPPKFSKTFTQSDFQISLVQQGVLFIITSLTFARAFLRVNPPLKQSLLS